MWSQERRRPLTDKTPAAKSLYRSIFWITFGIAFYQSNLSTGGTLKLIANTKFEQKLVRSGRLEYKTEACLRSQYINNT